MSEGGGKYDDLAAHVRGHSEATLAAVIVVGGNRGSGFSIHSRDPSLMQFLPAILEEMAKQIRAEQRMTARIRTN